MHSLALPRLLSFLFLFNLTTLHGLVLANVFTNHTSSAGAAEHIIIIDKFHPTPPAIAEVLQRLSLEPSHPDVRHIYNNSAFQGFAATMGSHCLGLLANMSDISLVEKASQISHTGALSRQHNAPLSHSLHLRDLSNHTRPGGPWGLQRISTTPTSSLPGPSSGLNFTYTYPSPSLGAGVDIYVLDTGIYTEHEMFGGRASMLWSYDNITADLDGHGTHVSGTAAGALLGVASNANLWGIRALDASGGGWSSDVVAGIDKVIQNHNARSSSNSPTPFVASVLSMSLAAAGTVASINTAVAAAITAGIHTCIAAGNSASDACSTSPASTGGVNGTAITVGAITPSTPPVRASFSNFGSCVDVYAPGESIVSAWLNATNAINMLDGTSMATPHVTGMVACAAAANASLARDPRAMKDWVVRNSVAMLDLDGGAQWWLATNGVLAGA